MRRIDKAIKIARISALVLFVAISASLLKGDVARATEDKPKMPEVLCAPQECLAACKLVGCAKGVCVQGDCICSGCVFPFPK